MYYVLWKTVNHRDMVSSIRPLYLSVWEEQYSSARKNANKMPLVDSQRCICMTAFGVYFYIRQ